MRCFDLFVRPSGLLPQVVLRHLAAVNRPAYGHCSPARLRNYLENFMSNLDKTHAVVSAAAGSSRSGFEFGNEDREIIFKHDVAGNLTFLNRAGELISGYSRQEVCGMNIAQFVAPEFAERVHDSVAGNCSKRLGTVYEIDIIAKNGQRIALEVSTQAVAGNDRAIEIEGIALPSVLRNPSQRPTRLRCFDEDLPLAG